jgi:hypothetical protein
VATVALGDGVIMPICITELGRTAITMGLKLEELVLIPELARALA